VAVLETKPSDPKIATKIGVKDPLSSVGANKNQVTLSKFMLEFTRGKGNIDAKSLISNIL
jgi:hypothetical protein